jgi:hypothetical protein
MAKVTEHKLNYPVGQAYTLGAPTQARTGLGKVVVITGHTEDRKLVNIQDKANPAKTAQVKYANLGSLVDEDGTLRCMITGQPWKARAKASSTMNTGQPWKARAKAPSTMNTDSEALRPCLRDPIPEIADAARYLDAAVSAHLVGRSDLARELIHLADIPAIREWTESLWGTASPYVKRRIVPNAPPSFPKGERGAARMPNRAEKTALLQRDGYHCRFCGIPVVRQEVRDRIRKAYPDVLSWGATNMEQHAAFQALWATYDHVLPYSRGGTSDLGNTVITCQPCNCARWHYTLEEVGLIDPMTRELIRSTWDGLERFH